MSIDMGGVQSDDLIDELEFRGYVVIDKDSFDEVVEQIKQWKEH